MSLRNRLRRGPRMLRIAFAVVSILAAGSLSSPAATFAGRRVASGAAQPDRAPLSLPAVMLPSYPPPANPHRFSQAPAWRTFAHGDDVRAVALQGAQVWAGTAGGGLVRWDPASGTYRQYLRPQDGLPGNDVRDIAVDLADNVWVATDRGVGELAPDGTWTVFNRETTGGKLTSDDVTAVAVDKAGGVWIGMAQFWDGTRWTGGGVARLVASQWTVYTILDGLPSDSVTDITADAATSDVWVTMGQYRELTLNPLTGVPVWVLRKGGIGRFREGTWRSYQRSDTDPQAFPRADSLVAVRVDARSRKWFVTSGGGLEVLEGEWVWAEIAVAGEGEQRVSALDVDNAGHVWMATADAHERGTGLSIFDAKGTIGDTSDDEWQHFTTADGLPSDTIRAVAALAPGPAWLGASDPDGDGYGLVRYRNGKFTTFSTTAEGGLPSNFVTAVAFDRQGRAWVGTASRGVAVLGDDGRWARYTSENTAGGLQTDLVRGLAVDDHGRVWVAVEGRNFDRTLLRYTDGGVSMFDGTSWHAYRIETTHATGPHVTETAANVPDGETLVPVAFEDRVQADAALASRYLEFEGDDTLYRYLGYDARYKALQIVPPLAKPFAAGTPVHSVQLGLADNRAIAVGYGLGRVWIGTGSLYDHSGSGLSAFNTATDLWEPVVKSPSLPSNLVTGISVADNTVWLATTFWGASALGGGVARGDDAGQDWSAYTQASSPGLKTYFDDVRAIAAGPGGAVWAGGYWFDGPSSQFRWPLVDATVSWLEAGQWRTWSFKDAGYVSSLAVDTQGRPWLSLSRDGRTPADVKPQRAYNPVGGVRVFNTGVWLPFRADNSGLADDDVRVVALSPDGERWFGTYQDGLSVMGAGDLPALDHNVYLPQVGRRPRSAAE